ncbi:MAG: ZIP family metal transporter [Bdellovibrionaceae bacterium]|nr:ZIP family metal transporter [Pseudobdellovibrionaceae bacterium]|tara:strand:+ start:22598 stop:23362 length:765 start_codon:yes stop_codon:yes gene_type:complete
MITTTAIAGTLIAGFATGLGAIPIYFKKEFSKTTLDVGLGFSAGVMLVASFLSLIIPGIEQAQEVFPKEWSLLIVLLGLLAGYFFIILVHDFLPHEHLHKETDMKHRRKMSRVTLLVLAITLHNLPEGLAVGVGFGGGDEVNGMALAIAIALQNMPEGLVVAFGLLSEGASKNKAFIMALLSGLVEPVAAVFGFLSSSFTQYSLPISLGFAGGTMLFVICQEMLPELFREGHEKHATLGVIIGVMTMLSIDFYF